MVRVVDQPRLVAVMLSTAKLMFSTTLARLPTDLVSETSSAPCHRSSDIDGGTSQVVVRLHADRCNTHGDAV